MHKKNKLYFFVGNKQLLSLQNPCNERDFQKLFGLNRLQFEKLLIILESNSAFTSEERGRPFSLNSGEQLLLFLLWLRHYPSQVLIASFFHVSQVTVSRIIQQMINSFELFFDQCLQFPKLRTQREKNNVNFRGQKVSVIVDGTEQEIYLSSNKMIERATYSGKKHKHTFTKLIACSPNGIIYFISQSYNGSKNDLQLAEFPENSFYKFLDLDEWIGADAGYRGLERIHPTILPFVQLSNQPELSKEEKEFNNEWASVRVIVENVICQIKKWKCCRLPLRCKTTDIHIAQRFHDKIWRICCILVNNFVESLRQ